MSIREVVRISKSFGFYKFHLATKISSLFVPNDCLRNLYIKSILKLPYWVVRYWVCHFLKAHPGASPKIFSYFYSSHESDSNCQLFLSLHTVNAVNTLCEWRADTADVEIMAIKLRIKRNFIFSLRTLSQDVQPRELKKTIHSFWW